MSETVHLKLPYLDAAQAQKHVTHNEALRSLDILVQLVVLDAALTEPPVSPAESDRYIVASAATGDWAGEDGNIATYEDGAWQFAVSAEGWLAFDITAAALLVRRASGWAAAGGYLGTVDQFGVNATADATNRLAVRSNAVLFSNVEEAEGGSGDIRFVVNKEADGDTASLLFQSGFSGRAEVGLAGDTDFVFKVSADGSIWAEAIRIDKDTGLPTILYDNGVSGLSATNVQDAIDEVAAGGGGGGGAVVSVFGRAGAVAAAASDYDGSQVDNDSSVTGATVSDALDALDTAIAAKQDALGFTPENAANKGAANGYASLDGSGKVPTGELSLDKGDVGLGNVTTDAQLTIASNLSDVSDAATAFANIKQAATTSATGVVEEATDAEVYAATDGKYIHAGHIESASAEVTLTDGSSPSFNWDAGINRRWTLGANRTLPNPTNGQPGTWRTIMVIGNSATDRTLTFGTQYEGDLPSLSNIDSAQSYQLTIYCEIASRFLVSSRNAADAA